MNAKTLSAALTELDPALLAEAEAYRPRKKIILRSLAAAAACLMILVGIRMMQPAELDLRLIQPGTARGISLASALEDPAEIRLELTVDAPVAATVRVSGGTLDGETRKIAFLGTKNLVWMVSADPAECYTLTVNAGFRTQRMILTFNPVENTWTVLPA